jgi:diketogulonate reductase-like aldo/keto reductase
MPVIGYGTAKIEDHEFPHVIHNALEEGYRYFDCARDYGAQTQANVGKALRESGFPREELFIATKLPAQDLGYDNTLLSFDEALKDMGLDYLDLYVIHFPLLDYDAFCESWRAMEKIYKEGRARAIGVSGFFEVHLERIFQMCEIPPHVDMLECNPFITEEGCRKYCVSKEIHVVSWFILGGPVVPVKTFVRKDTTRLLENETIISIAKNRNKTPAQITVRWAIQNGMTALYKSSNRERMRQNRDVFDFVLSDVEMHQLNALNYNRRYGLDTMRYDGITPC